MSSSPVISVRALSKTYLAYTRPIDRLLHRIALGKAESCLEVAAVRNVSFDIYPGETVGLVGRNGSGKSTLLQLICGIRRPSSGDVQTRGRVSALLELGAGFHPEFTGRENIFLQGAIQGFSRDEMAARFDDIVTFADIGPFIDQPVKTYSSGMFVRLAFAVATTIEPDVLIVDEALSVGDLAFQAKCFYRIRAMTERGTALILVTHSVSDMVKHCTRAILLDAGTAVMDDTSRRVAHSYLNRIGLNPEHQDSERPLAPDEEEGTPQDLLPTRIYYRPGEHRWGMGGANIEDCELWVNKAPYKCPAEAGATLSALVTIHFTQAVSRPVYGLILRGAGSDFNISTNSLLAAPQQEPEAVTENERVRCQFTLPLPAMPGTYYLSLGIATEPLGEDLIPLDRRYDAIEIQISEKPASQPSELSAIQFTLGKTKSP